MTIVNPSLAVLHHRLGAPLPSVAISCRAGAIYAPTADTRSTGCFAGASTIRARPIPTNRADPISSLRAMKLWSAWNDMTAAWAKLDHAVKAMRLRCEDG